MKRKIIGIFVCMLILATCLPVTGKIGIENDMVYSSPFFSNPHNLVIRLRNIYIKECGDDGSNEPGEWYFYIFMLPKFFHWKTDIYSANDNIPDQAQHFGKLCNCPGVRFTPQRIFIIAIDDDRSDQGVVNPSEILDWTSIRFAPPKGDYPETNMYEETFKWLNIYFKADVIVQFYY
ncbi:hypothetical protein AYK25_09780 [Thermoplasmatales archaeon SM1-50]|nr:MAG: hypothetical protein AYK25_09780 [Thermoplasmatales archaeon SM1-50]